MSTNLHEPAALSTLSDETLVVRAQDGSLPCFAELLGRFEGKVFNFILRRIGGANAASKTADAEDLTQETFLRAWEHLRSFTPRFRFSTWLFTIAGRVAIDHLRSRRVRQEALETMRRDAEAGTMRDDDEEFSMANDRSERLDACSALWNEAQRVLTGEQHSALWLRYAEDLSPPEIGRVLGRTQVAVRVMLFRARKTLAKRMAQPKDRRGEVAHRKGDDAGAVAESRTRPASGTQARLSATRVHVDVEAGIKPVAGGVV